MKKSELKALIKEVIQETSSETPYVDSQLGDGNDVSVQDCLAIARRLELALQTVRESLSSYVHGDEELTPGEINRLLGIVDATLSGR